MKIDVSLVASLTNQAEAQQTQALIAKQAAQRQVEQAEAVIRQTEGALIALRQIAGLLNQADPPAPPAPPARLAE